MKHKSNTKQEKVYVDKIGELAFITLLDNEEIKQRFDEGLEIEIDEYEYDIYNLEIPYQDNLKELIENDFEKWVAKAKNKPHIDISAEDRIEALEEVISAILGLE